MDIDKLIDDVVKSETQKKAEDQNQKSTLRKSKEADVGRKNRGLTNKHYEEYKREKIEMRKGFKQAKYSESFKPETVERVKGEIIESESAEEFRELYQLTCDSVLEQFKEENADLIKKHPNEWYRKVLIQIKSQTPKVGADEIEKLEVIWNVLYTFLVNIGITPCFAIFSLMVGVYEYQLKERARVNPKYNEFIKKIFEDSKTALLLDLTNNPYTQANKMYLGKALYGIVEQSQPKQIEVNHHLENYGNISAYRLRDKKEE